MMDESIVRHLEAPQVGTLKLSEAIRIGARIRPQVSGTTFGYGGSCAVGAAAEALGFPYNDTTSTYEAMDFIGRKLAHNGIHAYGLERLSEDIASRNDFGGTRESVADWLETQGL